MRNPASEEEDWRRFSEIGWGKGYGTGMKEIADVIQSHDDHDRAANRVDGRQA